MPFGPCDGVALAYSIRRSIGVWRSLATEVGLIIGPGLLRQGLTTQIPFDFLVEGVDDLESRIGEAGNCQRRRSGLADPLELQSEPARRKPEGYGRRFPNQFECLVKKVVTFISWLWRASVEKVTLRMSECDFRTEIRWKLSS